ncbi:MAG: inorganic phosphate transporter, partial [Selenomonadaceae bacterium]|nr:inorganic phosphate transporter [Selenomonadaceae bacterium]
GKSNPHIINSRFKRMQILSAAAMAFSHGSNDAQKSMGIITRALVSGGFLAEFEVPFYVKLLCATAMAFGTALGGWRIIKTIGGKIFKLEPISGFAADLNSSVVIFTATLLHLPVSTTHVVSGSIMGVGTAKRVNAVRWGVAQQMVTAWVLTIPCTALMGAAAYQLVLMLF